MILAATNPDTGAFGLAYVASVLAFVASLAVFCGVSVWLLGRFAAWHQDRHDNRALTDGDRHILHAIEQREQAHRERVTVPRQQLTERPHR